MPVSAVPTTVRTHCPFCALNCGLELDVASDRVVEVRGWRASPLTRGALCVKGRLAHEQAGHPERIRTPLLRRGGDFVEIGWDEALDRAVHGFAQIAARRGVAANAVLSGGSLTNEKVYLIGKLARLGLRTPHIDYNGRFCMSSASAAYGRAFGLDRMMTPLDELDRAEVAVVIGANLSAAFPVRLPLLLDRLRRRGGRVVVVDPRASRFVKPDDLHIALRPGTDAVFFGGVLREVHRLGLTADDFIAERTTGFETALAAVAHLPLERVATVCDVPVEVITEVASLVGSTPQVMWLHGRGPEQQVGGVENVTAIINLGLACGHVGRPGAGIDMLTGQRNGQGGREWGQRCNQLPAGRDIDDVDDRAAVASVWGVDPDVLPRSGRSYVEILQMAGDGSIEGLLSICTNMSVSAPDLAAVDEQMQALTHCVMIEPFLSASTRHADIVLPGTVFSEESGTITTIEGRVVRIDQATAPIPELADLEILCRLGAGLGAAEHFDFAWAGDVYDEMRRVSAGGPIDYAGISWERLRDDDGVFWPCPDADHPGTPQLFTDRFAHDDGRARFHAVTPPTPPRVIDVDHPLVLTTGRVLSQFLSGNQTRRIAELDRRAPEPILELHPDTAAELGLEEGRLVEVRSAVGRSEVAWAANPDLRRDTVFLPYHWVECNRLVAAELDPVSRIPGFKYTPVSVAPAAAHPEPALEALTG